MSNRQICLVAALPNRCNSWRKCLANGDLWGFATNKCCLGTVCKNDDPFICVESTALLVYRWCRTCTVSRQPFPCHNKSVARRNAAVHHDDTVVLTKIGCFLGQSAAYCPSLPSPAPLFLHTPTKASNRIIKSIHRIHGTIMITLFNIFVCPCPATILSY